MNFQNAAYFVSPRAALTLQYMYWKLKSDEEQEESQLYGSSVKTLIEYKLLYPHRLVLNWLSAINRPSYTKLYY